MSCLCFVTYNSSYCHTVTTEKQKVSYLAKNNSITFRQSFLRQFHQQVWYWVIFNSCATNIDNGECILWVVTWISSSKSFILWMIWRWLHHFCKTQASHRLLFTYDKQFIEIKSWKYWKYWKQNVKHMMLLDWIHGIIEIKLYLPIHHIFTVIQFSFSGAGWACTGFVLYDIERSEALCIPHKLSQTTLLKITSHHTWYQ